MPLSEAAAAQFKAYVVEIRVRAKSASGLLNGALGKVPGHVLRLALVPEYLGWSEAGFRTEPVKIGEATMLSAIGLVDGYFLPMARRVFGEAAIPEQDRRAMLLARWIDETKPARFNARDTRRSIGGLLRDPRHMEHPCEALVQAAWIRPAGVRVGPRAGRISSDYEVNPTLLATARAA
ncbi:hypothetical protein AA309_25350 [Microvirga vignae]|uniref:Uncharacterized protein n=1 Tax=Microvirga vignae TaxID=1225564 RepID=A0A0H1R5M2_9HYPH|nr:DUF3987 domain-containing protein [Microvirga vignae]KLK90535.1 hypothetical protein AA309_25350 [Microvirga vignae]